MLGELARKQPPVVGTASANSVLFVPRFESRFPSIEVITIID
jgi:hypothetical protein